MKRSFFVLIIFQILLGLSYQVHAESALVPKPVAAPGSLTNTPFKVDFIRPPAGKKRNPKLEFKSEQEISEPNSEQNIKLDLLLDTDSQNAFVYVKGSYHLKDHTVLVNSNRIDLQGKPDSDDKSFQLLFPINGQLAKLEFLDIGPLGEIVSETVMLKLENWKEFSIAKKDIASQPRSSWNLSLGTSLISYSETLQPEFSQMALTLKGGYSYPINQKWSFAIGGFFTALPLTSSEPDMFIRFLGINLRVGYLLPWLSKPWSLSLMGGAYYTTTFGTTPTAFGFQNMSGPQAFPVLSRSFDSKSSASIYVKYAVISSGASLSPEGSEMATGLSYLYLLNGNRAVSIGLDAAQFEMHIEKVLRIESRSLSFSVGYKW